MSILVTPCNCAAEFWFGHVLCADVNMQLKNSSHFGNGSKKKNKTAFVLGLYIPKGK